VGTCTKSTGGNLDTSGALAQQPIEDCRFEGARTVVSARRLVRCVLHEGWFLGCELQDCRIEPEARLANCTIFGGSTG